MSIKFYNNPLFSDVILQHNDQQIYVSSSLLAQHSTFFENIKIDTNEINRTPERIFAVVTKRVIKIDGNLDKNILEKVLQHAYECPLVITNENVIYMSQICKYFQMTNILNECYKFILNHPKINTLCDDYLNANEEKSDFEKVYYTLIIKHRTVLPIKELFIVSTKFSLDDFKFLLEHYSGDMAYNLVENYINNNSLTHYKKKLLISLINLNDLSIKILISKIKNNPLVDKESYYGALECVSLKNSANLNEGSIFGFGKYSETYEGYRLITAEECKSIQFLKIFKDHYEKYHGIRSLDNFKADILCNDTHPLCIYDTDWIRLCYKSVNIGEHYCFETNLFEPAAVQSNLMKITSHPIDNVSCFKDKRKVGLFVCEPIQF